MQKKLNNQGLTEKKKVGIKFLALTAAFLHIICQNCFISR